MGGWRFEFDTGQLTEKFFLLTLFHPERSKLYTILAFLSAIGLTQWIFILITHVLCFCRERILLSVETQTSLNEQTKV